MKEITDTELYAMNDDAVITMIGAFVRHHRLEQDLSQQTLADRAGIHRSTLADVENGKRCHIVTLIQLLRVLNRLDVFKSFQVNRQLSPMAIAKLELQQRKRASRTNQESSDKEHEW